jgi:pimeloyl-ACP methyl ester carboxylesterase
MWSLVLPYFIAKGYNIVLLSQRGHGKSTFPSSLPSSSNSLDKRVVTIPLLASDIHTILSSHLNIPSVNIKSVIGVSQGGATTLAFAALFEDATPSIIVCDTAPCTPAGNQSAWEERIQLVGGDQLGGMKRLADVTLPRWFPPGSQVSPQEHKDNKRAEWVSSLITSTPVSGFEAGARALGSYDTIQLGILDAAIPNVLLLAGSLDGAGKVGASLQQFCDEWNGKRKGQGYREAEFVLVQGSGHLPMIDNPEKFWKVVEVFLGTV